MATCPHPDRPAKAFGLCAACYRHLYYLNDRQKEIDRAAKWGQEHVEKMRAHQKKWRDTHPEYNLTYYPIRNARRRAENAERGKGRSPLFSSFQHWLRGKGMKLRGVQLILAFEAFEAGYRRGIAHELTQDFADGRF